MLDAWGQEYILLALRIEKHVPGFVDSYYGPPELKAKVEAESPPWPVPTLFENAETLCSALSQAGYDARRTSYLEKQLTGIETVLRKLMGEEIPFTEEVMGCFDVLPQRTDESEFEAALQVLDRLLPGDGPVRDRMITWRQSFEITNDQVLPLVHLVQAELRQRTAKLVSLPAGEAVIFELVTDKPWGGYNWYLGGYRSRVEINTDLPVKAHAIPGLIAHEGYPGHHTEHAVKEAALYQAGGRAEHCILLINVPECLISEGIASLALEAVMPDEELTVWLKEVYFPAAGFPQADVERMMALNKAMRALAAVSGNAAFLLHQDGRDRDDVAAYLQKYGLRSLEEARQSLKFLTNPLWRVYTFTYFYGERLLRAWLDRVGWREGFHRLLSEPLYPSQLVDG